MTACHFPFEESTDQGDKNFVWVLPELQFNPVSLCDTFEVVVQNENAWDNSEPHGLSPEVMTHHHFYRYFPLGPGKDNSVWVCGPNLAFAKGDNIKSFPEVISEEGLDYKPMPGGRLLIKVGPKVGTRGYNHGECGDAPVTDVRIFDLDKDLDLHTAIALGGVICSGPPFSQDFTISSDWSQITEYDKIEEFPDSWSSTTYCLKSWGGSGYNYEPCGEKQNVQPPNPPVLKQLRQ